MYIETVSFMVEIQSDRIRFTSKQSLSFEDVFFGDETLEDVDNIEELKEYINDFDTIIEKN